MRLTVGIWRVGPACLQTARVSALHSLLFFQVVTQKLDPDMFGFIHVHVDWRGTSV